MRDQESPAAVSLTAALSAVVAVFMIAQQIASKAVRKPSPVSPRRRRGPRDKAADRLDGFVTPRIIRCPQWAPTSSSLVRQSRPASSSLRAASVVPTRTG